MRVPNPPDAVPGAEIIRQLQRHGIQDARLLQVMSSISRAQLLPPETRDQALIDGAVPIGCEQTMSQPVVVAAMTQALRLRGAERVLEIGTGSGYQTAVLSRLAAEVFTVERLPTLSLRARGILDGNGSENIHYRIGDGTLGWPEEAPFDRIIVTAGAPTFPTELFRQLIENGILVVPIGDDEGQQLTVVRKSNGEPISEEIMACRFVKLIGQEGWFAC
ncbi:protein-L-isoaspartate(D-aspartate) O-methyltransferase [Singulisphaera sp. PoT]|uniref:protein-L-isoaspartate(D-aspartate) O-methyltransferase n=1 Tax=Singulisphaera sp. PoT TaxID=3411797 RepID=UPI003BF6070F